MNSFDARNLLFVIHTELCSFECTCVWSNPQSIKHVRGRRVGDRMVVGFITTYAINAYHY